MEKERSDIKSLEDKLSDLRALKGLEGQQVLRKVKLENANNAVNELCEKKQQLAGIKQHWQARAYPQKRVL